MKRKITILVPVYNEEQVLLAFYDEIIKIASDLSKYDWEFLFVNDGSRDNSMNILEQLRSKDKRVVYVDLSRNFGKESAMLAGFDYATGDCAINMDADLQHPPSLIPELIGFWEQGYDDVYAKRKDRPGESFLRKKFSHTFYKMMSKFSEIEIPQNTGDFRLLDRKCIDALNNLRETQRYTKGLYAWIGFNKKEVFYKQQERTLGNSKWSFSSLFDLAIDGITSFSVLPLRFASLLGFVISFFAFIYLIIVVLKSIFYGENVQGFPTIVTLILFLGGMQLVAIGIIGEYLGKIFNETKHRPNYIIKKYSGNEK